MEEEKRQKEERRFQSWLRTHLIPRLAAVFGVAASRLDKAECSIRKPSGSFYLSDLFFASIRFPGEEQVRRVLVKLPPRRESQRLRQNYEQLFSNEILFYEKLARFGRDFARCYWAGPDPEYAWLVVLEDLQERGFSVAREKVNVPLDYAVAALRSIARFHASGYSLKVKSPEEFQQLVKGIREVRYGEDAPDEAFAREMNRRIGRVIRSLRSREPESRFAERMAAVLEDCYANVMIKCWKPLEPLATIVHGDCTINNLLFRPDRRDPAGSTAGLEAVLVDMALLMYSSPATDVATFLYLSCSREDVKERTTLLLKAYHDCLAQSLKEQMIWDPERYSYHCFEAEYKRCALFGYVLAAYFLPTMTEYERNNNVLQLDEEALQSVMADGGGEALSDTLVDMLIDMRESGWLQCYYEQE